MDGTAFSSAQGAVDSLLGRLTTALRDELQLLRGVRGDVRFIKDEMESMNGLLLHLAWLTDDGGHHHHVRAWTRQVRDLANDSQGCVNRYVRHLGAGDRPRKGPLGYVRRIRRLVWTIPARRRIAREIQDLKVRAREVGERRKRYGITVPLITSSQDRSAGATSKPSGAQACAAHAAGQDDPWRLALLDNGAPTVLEKDVKTMIKWLTEDAYDNRRLKVIPILGPSCSGKSALAWRVYQDPAVASWFDCKAWSNVGDNDVSDDDDDDTGDDDAGGGCCYSWADTAAQLLANLETTQHGISMQRWDDDGDEPTTRELKWHLKGRRFLLVLDGLDQPSVVRDMEQTLQWCPYTAGSAVVVITRNKSMVQSCYPYNTLHLNTRPSFSDRALALLPHIQYGVTVVLLKKLLSTLNPDAFSMKMLLHLLFVNPNRTTQELQSLSARMSDDEPRNNAHELFMFCYNDMPSHCRSCLLYLSIFPRGRNIRRTSLVRRWVVEGLIAKADGLTALDVAERCFDALVDRGFVRSWRTGAAGKVKVCRMHDSVHDFVTWLVKHENLVDRTMAPHLAPHLSIHNGIEQQPASEKSRAPCFNPLWNWRLYDRSARPRSNRFDSIVTFLDWLPKSSQLELLKVLDLEGCKSLKNRHLKIVCNHLFQLKYLSLRKTDITQLPKKIEKLRYLETLDIRETTVCELGKTSLILQMLKHLLAGRTEHSQQGDVIRSSESFSTVHIPHGIGSMGNIQILSHVSICSDAELNEVCQLIQLRKLGVVLLQGTQISLSNLFRVINELSNCLRSLSIRIEQPRRSEMHRSLSNHPPKFLESINISGLRDELPDWIEELHQLAKVTLRETSLTENSLRILGQLKGLRCLRLRYNSFIGSRLAFREEEFKNLKFLVVEGSHITNICFTRKAAPKLQKIVWSFTNVQTISGVDHLPSLNEFVLNGGNISGPARQAIAAYPNRHVFKYNPYMQE